MYNMSFILLVMVYILVYKELCMLIWMEWNKCINNFSLHFVYDDIVNSTADGTHFSLISYDTVIFFLLKNET